MSTILIADSGSSKTEWCLLSNTFKKTFQTQGISPYFLNASQIENLLREELINKLKNNLPDQIFFYGTGCSNAENVQIVRKSLRQLFPGAKISVDHDLMGTARALCGNEKGIACILGTGSNSCYYNGKKIVKNSPGLGYILGDEGSGAYLGKKVLQHFLYGTFDEDLTDRFLARYSLTRNEILDSVYKQPLANRYIAAFTGFLKENRGHYMVENIIEDAFHDFFFQHIHKYKESWTMPIHFVGSVAYGFKDVLASVCRSYELQLGIVFKSPMQGLIQFHRKDLG